MSAFIVKGLEDDVFGLGLAIEDTGGAFIPVLTFFPGCPVPLRIEAVQLVRTTAYIRIEGKQDRICLLLEDVLGHDPGAAPAVEEVGVEAGVGLLQLELDRVLIYRRHRVDVIQKESMVVEAVILLQGLYRKDDIVSGEGLAVIPGDTLAQRDREACEICVVCRVTVSKAGDDRTGGEVDRP